MYAPKEAALVVFVLLDTAETYNININIMQQFICLEEDGKLRPELFLPYEGPETLY